MPCVKREGATYPASRPVGIDRRGVGYQPRLNSRGAHITINREAKYLVYSTAGGSRGGGRSGGDYIRGLAPNPTERRIPLRTPWPLTAGGRVANRQVIPGVRTLNLIAKHSSPPAPRWAAVGGGGAVDKI